MEKQAIIEFLVDHRFRFDEKFKMLSDENVEKLLLEKRGYIHSKENFAYLKEARHAVRAIEIKMHEPPNPTTRDFVKEAALFPDSGPFSQELLEFAKEQFPLIEARHIRKIVQSIIMWDFLR